MEPSSKFTLIVDSDTLVSKDGVPTYQAPEQLQKLKGHVTLILLGHSDTEISQVFDSKEQSLELSLTDDVYFVSRSYCLLQKAKARGYNTIWYYTPEVEYNLDGEKPDFFMVCFTMLESLFQNVAPVDSEKKKTGEPVPSHCKYQYGFLFKSLSEKTLAKNSIKALFYQRASF